MSTNDPRPADQPTEQVPWTAPGAEAPEGAVFTPPEVTEEPSPAGAAPTEVMPQEAPAEATPMQEAPTAQWAPYGEAPGAPATTGETPDAPAQAPAAAQPTTASSQWYERVESQDQGAPGPQQADPSGQQQAAYGQQYGQQQAAYGQQYGQQQAAYGQQHGQQQAAYGQQYGQQQGAYPPGYAATAQKSMIVAIILAIFLGSLGVHNFYLGFTQKGIVQLVLTVVGWATSWLLIGLVAVFAVFVWVIVDIIQIATRQGQYVADANGVPLQ